jgi:hypothetical protein
VLAVNRVATERPTLPRRSSIAPDSWFKPASPSRGGIILSAETEHRKKEADMMNSDYYRERAQEVRAVASRVKFQETKAQLLNVANQYDHLAAQAAELAANAVAVELADGIKHD